MRARNIKPSLFKNEILGTADPLLTILFEGLWCEADREGRLEDRPLRLKAEILPYRNNADIDALLDWLCENGFIARYEVEDTRIIQVLKFAEHQRPHNNEAASVLAPMDASKHNQGRKSLQPRKQALRSDSPSLIPDSGFLIPDPNARENAPRGTPSLADDSESANDFQLVKAAYPTGIYSASDWLIGEREARLRIDEGHTWGQLVGGCERYAQQCAAKGSLGTQYVESPKRFFLSPGCKFLEPFPLPAKKADVRLASNLTAADEFMRRTESA